MCAKLALNVQQPVIDSALPYFDLRHLLVHKESRYDDQYCMQYPALRVTAGNEIVLSNSLIAAAKQNVTNLDEAFDNQVVAQKILMATDYQP